MICKPSVYLKQLDNSLLTKIYQSNNIYDILYKYVIKLIDKINDKKSSDEETRLNLINMII